MARWYFLKVIKHSGRHRIFALNYSCLSSRHKIWILDQYAPVACCWWELLASPELCPTQVDF